MNIQMEKYLKPTPVIDCDHPFIKAKISELAGGEEDILEKARKFFYFVRDEIKYNIYVSKSLPENFRASNTLSRGEGYCVQKSVLLVALARAAGIPAGLGFARIRNNLLPEKAVKWLGTNVLPFHGYAELYLNGKWVKATPSFDIEMCEKIHIFPVEFDGQSHAMLHSHNKEGKLHIEYLQYLGDHYQDLPLETLWDTLIKNIGRQVLEPPGKG